MKNIQESNQDDESITNKIIDIQSETQSEKNYFQRNILKTNLINDREKAMIKSNSKININYNTSINKSNIPVNFSIKLNTDGKELINYFKYRRQ